VFEYSGNSAAFDPIVMTTDVAPKTWYQGKQYYDFKAGKAKVAKGLPTEEAALRKKLSDDFTMMVWKGSSQLGLGIKGKWVVGYFCVDKGNNPSTAQSFVDNVSDLCMVFSEKDKTKKYNRCYNDMARNYHNEKRAVHKLTKSVETGVDIA